MDCEHCGSAMHWEGSLRDGHLACPVCDIGVDMGKVKCEPFSPSMADALLDAYKQRVDGLQNVVPSQYVDLQCANCGQHCKALNHLDPNNLLCPHCGQRHFLRRYV